MAGARCLEERMVWQRMHELGREVWKATSAISDDVRFRDQIRDASDSAASNVAERFCRFSPRQFAHLLDLARASADETRLAVAKGPRGRVPPSQIY
jgi:four helix bundle protein